MKNLVFNLRTAKAQAEGCAKVSRMAKVLTTLTLLLTLGVGQMWGDGDPWVKNDVSTGLQGTKTVGDKLNGGSEWWYNYQTNGGWSSATDIQVLIGTSSSSYSTVNATWYADSGSDKKVHADIGSFTFDKSGLWYAVGKYYASSKTAYTSGTSFTSNSSLSSSMNTSNSPYWTVLPPAVNSFSVARNGYLAGSGTEGDPYLVASGSNLTLTASGSQAHTDAKSSINYKFGDDAYSTTATKNITVTSSGSIAVKARCKNTSASLDGAETETITIYYAPVSVKDITVYIYVGGCTPDQINSLVLTGTPYVGSKALSGVHINTPDGWTTDSNWRSYTFYNVTKVHNLQVAGMGGAIPLKNIENATEDFYYRMFDGTELNDKCVSAPNLTWTTAPADGKVGNYMTAVVNTTPVSGGSPRVTWSTSNSNIAAVNESTGEISYEAAGSATITAHVTWIATGDYCAGSQDLKQTITVSTPSQKAELGSMTLNPSGTQNPINYALSVTSKHLAHPVVVFFVNDGTTTYEVVGAPYGAEGNSAVGTIGTDAAYTTVHKATFTAPEAKTYTVSAKLYEGLLVENFETADYTTWETVGGGSSSIVSNDFVSANNGSPKVRKITPNGEDWKTYLTRSTDKWVNGYQYIHTKMYYTAGDALQFKIHDNPDVVLAVAHGTNSQWNKVVFNNSDKANIDFMFPWIVNNTSAPFYIDDIILSDEETMTEKASFNWNCTVTLENNGATTPGTESVNVTYGSTLSKITVPTKDGYTFGGYYTEENGAGTLQIDASGVWQNGGYVADGKWNSGSDQTLYANWTKAELSPITLNPSGTQNYAGEPIDITMSVTSTYLAHPVVVFLVNDGTTTYEVVGAPYGAEGNSAAGTIGDDVANTTVHKATFTASETKTYTVSAKLYEGELIDNFEGEYTRGWAGFHLGNSGGMTFANNPQKMTVNGSNKVMQVTRDGAEDVDHGGALMLFVDENEKANCGAAGSNNYTYIHARMKDATGATHLKNNDAAENTDDIHPSFGDGTSSDWRHVTYHNTHCSNNFLFFMIQKGNKENKTVYIDDIILSNEETMTEKAPRAKTASFSIKSGITRITFSPGNIVAPSSEVIVRAFVEPTPEEPTTICWRVLYSNDNPLDPQPTFTPANQGESVRFIAPEASGSYKVEATLCKGNGCGGEEIHTFTAPFQVAGDHTVTVQYKCGNTTIKASTSATGQPLEWTAITAPDIVGYSFLKWVEGDGITIEGATNGEKADATINFKAIYDGQLTAIYSKKNMIYFNNTLGWSDVWVYFYTSNKYWDNNYGTGAWRGQYFDGSRPYYNMHRGQMTQIEGTNIWYFDYTAEGWDGWQNVAFTNMGDKSGQGANPDDAAPDNDHAYFSNTTSSPIQVIRRGDHKTSLPMFVPLTGVDPVKMNNNKAEYYNEGYWMNYPENTGYTLHIYSGTNPEVQDEIRSIAFPFTADKTMPMEVTLELNANTTYGYEIHRADNTYHANDGTIKINASSDIKLSKDQRGGIKTSAAGDYVFKLNFGNSSGYGYLFSVQYPVAVGSYRIVYTESGETLWSGHPKPAGWHHPSRSIEKKDGAKDIVSFYVKQGAASMKFQYASAVDGEGNVTWTDVTGAGGTIDLSSITKSGVYNFHLTQTNGSISVEKIEPYTGNYYIRTDNAGSTKWDNYRAADHQMTYSEFSKDRATNTFGELYTHYYMHWCPRGTNVKFCIANDYSSCITDTLVNDVVSLGNMADAGWLNRDNASEVYRDKFSANIRFMYDERTNKISRAYMSSSTNTDRKFLVLKSDTEFWNSDGSALNGSGESATEGNYEAIFKDNEDWIYEREIKLTPGQKFKLYASYAQATAQEEGSQHFRGNYVDDDWENAENYVALVGGTGDACNVRIIYDFKTNRLLAAMVPSGEISTEMDIYADVMFIREHQGDIEQLTFTPNGSITNIKSAYAVMRFNKWTLNNKEKTGSHNPLASPASIYERSLYYVSFPFPVNLSEVFGFGTYGQHWIIQRYRGDLRAQQGFWAESDGFWEFIWNRNGVVLQPNEGYILTLETELLGEESDVWGPDQRSNQIELFFPSSGPLGSITNESVTQTLPAHTCTIDKTKDQFGNPTGLQDSPYPSTSYNRTIFDSHWNIMSVPTYVNVDDPSFANTTWIANGSCPKFLYTWNMNDNTLTATSGKGFMYHAMHAYTVQYHGNVTWTTSVTPTAAPQRNTEYRGEYEFCLEVQQDEQMIDRTYVRLSDDENVTTGFEFGEDMTKQFNSRKANIFTIAGNTSLGGNSLPLSTTQTTVVPVGVKIKTAGDYTFSIPEGTEGIGVTLVDNETGVRTLLSALDYTVNLTAGTHDERFWLEISPIYNTPTGIEDPTSDSSLKGRAQKRIIDGVLYIVKDGKIFDARGTRVE